MPRVRSYQKVLPSDALSPGGLREALRPGGLREALRPGGLREALRESKGRIDVIRSRAGLLRGRDRGLVQIYLDNAAVFRQMARLAGVNEANVARRIHKIVRRLLDGSYITCLRYRDRFTQEQIEIARDYFVDGLSMREIADRHEITFYAVRKTMKMIQRLTDVNQRTEDAPRNPEDFGD